MVKRRWEAAAILGAAILAGTVLSWAAPGQERTSEREQAAAAFARLESAGTDWRAARKAGEELAALGEAALSFVERGAEHHQDERVRRACYSLLINHFMPDERVAGMLANAGLADDSARIRYMCVFALGEHRVHAAHRRLRIEMDEAHRANDEFLYLAAAKSLAELGEADVMLALYEAATHDRYMPRYFGHLGLAALTGKAPSDFEDYNYSEGAVVSGGIEAIGAFDAVEDAEATAHRYRAVAAYFRWLRANKPDLYKHATGSR